MSGGLLAQNVPGQEGVRGFLARAATAGRLSHAYLLVGAAGSGKLELARALAQAAVCEQGGCGACDDCLRAARSSHPDVHVLHPESAQGYLVAQIRALIDDLALAPVRARRKVYVLDEADRLTSATANALLKSLEEPPTNTMFVLLASSADAVLPTVASRCQAVAVPSVSAEAAARALSGELGVPENLCRRAIGCCPNPAAAREFLGSPARQEARATMLRALDRLHDADALDMLNQAKAAVAAAKAPLADFKEAQAAALEENAQVLPASALRELEERQKRELAARERSGIMELLGAARSLLRDALGRAAGEARPGICDDCPQTVERYARRLGTDGLAQALALVARAEERVRMNVSPQLAVEALLFDIKEIA